MSCCKNGISDENEKFCKRLCERFLEHIKSLETINRAEIATLQCLESVYIWKAFAKRLKNLNKLCTKMYQFIERILKSVATALQNFHETLYIVFDKRSENVQTQ